MESKICGQEEDNQVVQREGKKRQRKLDEEAREKEKVLRVIWSFDIWDPHDDSHSSLKDLETHLLAHYHQPISCQERERARRRK